MPNDLVVAGDLNITGEMSASVKGNTITPATAAINLVTSGSSDLAITIDAIDGTLLLDGHDKIEMRSGGAASVSTSPPRTPVTLCSTRTPTRRTSFSPATAVMSYCESMTTPHPEAG